MERLQGCRLTKFTCTTHLQESRLNSELLLKRMKDKRKNMKGRQKKTFILL